jgi:tetratricopeptide (TPR) repeat protein
MSDHPPSDDETTAVESDDGRLGPAPTNLPPGVLPVSSGPSRYELLEPLGRGGGGVVWAAYDRELDRRVAVKLLRAGASDSSSHSSSQARLLREAQAMAQLSHPNVIPVYDVAPYEAGELKLAWPELAEEDELPADRGVFIVMEAVEGDSLIEWLRPGPRPWLEVLEIMLPAGRGLAAAHAQGLVHRDFKPGNVMLGSDRRPRILDFGLARSGTNEWSDTTAGSQFPPTTQQLAQAGPRTQTGMVLGTPTYMAPEQHRGEPASEAADQFSFCAVLYEAFCGRRAFRGDSVDELRRQKENRAGPPAPDGVRIPDWLWSAVQRGLSPEPSERHPSMAALLTILEAGPRRRRRRRLLLGVSAVALAGVGVGAFGWIGRAAERCAGRSTALATIWDDAVRSEAESAFSASGQEYAVTSWASAAAGLDGYAERWTTMREQVCLDTYVEGTQSAEVLRWRDSCLDEARAALQELSEQLREADSQTIEHAVIAVSNLPALDRCANAEVARSELERSDQERAQRARIEGELARIRALMDTGKYALADDLATDLLARALREEMKEVEARVRIELGRAAKEMGEFGRAEEELHAALTAAEEVGAEDEALRASVHLVAVVGVELQRHSEADRMADQLGARLKRRGREDALAADYQETLGMLREKQARYEETFAAFYRALELRTALFPSDSPAVAAAHAQLALGHVRVGSYEEAEKSIARALEIYRGTVGEAHPLAAKALRRSAIIEQGRGRPKVAVAKARESLALLERAHGAEHPSVATAMADAGQMLHFVGQEDEALELSERALELSEKVHGKQHGEYARILGNLALVYRALGRTEDAIVALRRQLEIFGRIYEPDNAGLGYAHLNLASVLRGAGQPKEALVHARRALEVWEKAHRPNHATVVSALNLAATIEMDLGRGERAIPLLERAVTTYERLEGYREPGLIGQSRFLLAWVLQETDRERAIELALQARQDYGAAGAARRTSDLATVEKWLREQGIELPPLSEQPESKVDAG